jgi:hypothetical protein
MTGSVPMLIGHFVPVKEFVNLGKGNCQKGLGSFPANRPKDIEVRPGTAKSEPQKPLRDPIQTDVEPRGGMGETADADAINAGFRDCSNSRQIDTPRSFELDRRRQSVAQFHGGSELFGAHIIQQYDVWLLAKHRLGLGERIGFDFHDHGGLCIARERSGQKLPDGSNGGGGRGNPLVSIASGRVARGSVG